MPRRYPSNIVGLPFVGKDGVHCAVAVDRAGLAEADHVLLERDVDNLHDPDAIAVFTDGIGERWHIGFVPKRHTSWIGEQIDEGRPIRATIDTIHRDDSGRVTNVDLHIDLARKGESFDDFL